jgi:hypothetical protein
MMPDPRVLLNLDAEAGRRLSEIAASVTVPDCNNRDDDDVVFDFMKNPYHPHDTRSVSDGEGGYVDEPTQPDSGSMPDAWSPIQDESFIMDVKEDHIHHNGQDLGPTTMPDGSPAVISFNFDTPSDDYYCVFDFGDIDGKYGVTLSGTVLIEEPQMDDDGNLVAIYIIDYEAGTWRRVFLTGEPEGNDDGFEIYDFEVYAEPGQLIRWVHYTDDDMQLNMAAEVTFGQPVPEGHECETGDVFDHVFFLPHLNRWVTSVDQGGHARYRHQGTDYWILNNGNNARNLAFCAGDTEA